MCLRLSLSRVLAVNFCNIKIAVLAYAVLAALVQGRTHQHVLRGLCQPRALTFGKLSEIPFGAGIITGIETGSCGQIIFIGLSR